MSAEVLKTAGLVVAVLAASLAFVPSNPRLRGAAVVAILLLAPTLLVAEVWNTHELSALRASPLVAAGALAGALAVVAVLAFSVRRWPWLFAVICVATLWLRVPVHVGGRTANLLIPLYFAIASGGVAYAYERLAARAWRLAPAEPRPRGLELALLLAVGIYAAQALYSSDFRQAFENVVFFYLPFLLLFKLMSSVAWSKQLILYCLATLAAVGLLVSAVGFWEYETKRLILNPRLVESNQFEPYFRVNSLFYDPNIYGRFLAIVMLCVTPALLWPAKRRDLAYASAALVVFWAALVLTFSRSSFWALLAGLCVLAALRFGAIRIAAPLLIAAAVSAYVVTANPGLVGITGDASKAINQASSGRLNMVSGGLEMFSDRPVFGYGSGSFATVYSQRKSPSTGLAATASHTVPVTVASEQGVVGLLAYLLVLGFSFVAVFRGLRALKGSRSPPLVLYAGAAVAAAFCALWVHSLLYADFLEDPFAWALLGAATGLWLVHTGDAITGSRAAERQAGAQAPPPRQSPLDTDELHRR